MGQGDEIVGSEQSPAVAYEIGDVVNRHRWDGSDWVPVRQRFYARPSFWAWVLTVGMLIGIIAANPQQSPLILVLIAVLAFFVWQAVKAGEYAARKGRSKQGFFVLAFFLPVVAWIVLLAIAPTANADLDTTEAPAAVKPTGHDSKVIADMRTCPFCAEQVKAAAVVCRYCGRDLPAASQE